MSAFEHAISEGGDLLYGSYVVDAADRDNILISRNELHDLLNKPSLGGIPLLVLGNKIDKPEAISKPALIDQMYDVLLFRTLSFEYPTTSFYLQISGTVILCSD